MTMSLSARAAWAANVLATLAMLIGVTATANAADPRYAEPNGDGAEPCAASDPCDIETAVNNAVDGDEVVVKPGSYTTAAPLGVGGSINLHGVAGQPAPEITAGVSGGLLLLFDNATVTGLHLTQPKDFAAGGGAAIYVADSGSGSTINRVVARSNGNPGCFVDGASATLTNTACISTAGDFSGFGAAANAGDTTLTLQNVTALETNAGSGGSSGLSVSAVNSSDAVVNASNVIAQAPENDVEATSAIMGSSVTINMTSSNYSSEHELNNGTITDPGTGGNQTADPQLAADGYHQQPGSQTIDAGSAAPLAGTADVDEETRSAGLATDIGADEFQPPLVTPPTPETPTPPTPAARFCHGTKATILAGTGVTRGTPKRDVVVGTSGPDTIKVLGGNDLVCAAGGRDTVLGGAGRDRLLGQAGADRLYGQAGRDQLLGGAGRDLLLGGAGLDALVGGPAKDLTKQ